MDKLRQSFKPYTFRARMLTMLTISALVASMISLTFSYIYSRYSLSSEISADELELASNLLELYEQTSLNQDEIAQITVRDNMSVAVLPVTEAERLPCEILEQLESIPIVVQANGLAAVPSTFVRLDDRVLVIHPSQQFNVFWIALLRIAFAGISFFAVFMMMSTLATWRIAKPVSQLTVATRKVADGDFGVHLPEDRPDELGQLMRSFNRMTDALGRTSWLQKDFIASISHEFRTPIASIKGFARLLQMPNLTEEQQQEYISLIAQESDRLSRLSNTLLRLSALEQQAGPASLSDFQLDEQVRQVILRMEPSWSERNIDWQLSLASVSIRSDSELLNQVWTNLIQNAIKFSPENSEIEISVYADNDCAHFVIRDHGIGMDSDALSRIFDRFYQADRSRSHEGIGLGLTLVKRILDLLGGTIQVESTPGEGSTFSVMLPCRPTEPAKENNP